MSGTQTKAVSGGTGRFRGAEGEIAVKLLSPSEANLTIAVTH